MPQPALLNRAPEDVRDLAARALEGRESAFHGGPQVDSARLRTYPVDRDGVSSVRWSKRSDEDANAGGGWVASALRGHRQSPELRDGDA
jgi:hypothetical protein